MDLARQLGETFEKATNGANPKQDMAQRWAEVLQVADGSPDFYLGLTTLLRQAHDLIAEIQAAPNINERAKGLYCSAAQRLMPFVTPASAHGSTVGQLNQLKDSVDVLFLASDVLPDRLVPDIQASTLEQLCSELEALKATAAAADVTAEIRQLVIGSLDTLLMALRSYDVFGPQGVARIYGSVAAELARVAGDQQTPKKARGLLKSTMDTVKKLGAVVVWAGATVTGAHELLTHGPEILEQIEQVLDTGGQSDAQQR